MQAVGESRYRRYRVNQEAVPPPQAATPLRRPAASGPAAAGRRRRQSGGASLSINRHRHQQPPPPQLVCEPLITRRLTASLTSLSCVAATGKTHGRRQGYSTAANSAWWLRPQQQPQKPCRQPGAGVVRCRLPAPSAVPRSPAAAHLRARRRLGARVFGALLRAGAWAGRGRSTSGAWPAECGGAVRVGRCRWGQPKQPLRKRRPGQARTGQDRPGQARTGQDRTAASLRLGPAARTRHARSSAASTHLGHALRGGVQVKAALAQLLPPVVALHHPLGAWCSAAAAAGGRAGPGGEPAARRAAPCCPGPVQQAGARAGRPWVGRAGGRCPGGQYARRVGASEPASICHP